MSVTINLNQISDIVDSSISLQQRGILISLAILRDSDPELTWAKFKSKSTVDESVKSDLLSLHDKGFIAISKAKEWRDKLKSDRLTPEVTSIVDFMNETWGTKYKASTASIHSAITARLKEYSIDDIKLVISNRFNEWKDDPTMSKYLAPDTVFRPSKFVKYLEHARKTHSGQALLNSTKFDLKQGDQITEAHLKAIVDEEIYNVRTCKCDKNGNIIRMGSTFETLYGKNIKRNISIVANYVKDNGGHPDFVYLYWPNK